MKQYLISGLLLIVPQVLSAATSASDLVYFNGNSAGDEAGYAVAGGGDVNGDGYDDILIGAPTANAVYLFYGGKGGTAYGELSTTDLADADATFLGIGVSDETGTSVALAGDVNNDGYDDILIGAPAADSTATDAGTVYLVPGDDTDVIGNIDLSNYDSTTITAIFGEEANDRFGAAIAAGEDFGGTDSTTGDGYDDFLVGAPLGSFRKTVQSGKAYFFKGGVSGSDAGTILTDANANTADIVFLGADPLDSTGSALAFLPSSAKTAILIGAPGTQAWYLYPEGAGHHGMGSYEASVDLSNTSPGVTGLATFSGDSDVLTTGDYDHSGFKDFVVASPRTAKGTAYLFNSTSQGYPNAAYDIISENDGEMTGQNTGDRFGSASASGDFNGDGYDDLLISAIRQDPSGSTNAGATYLFYGSADGLNFEAGISADNFDHKFTGVSADDEIGFSLASAGDINNDGYDEFLIGAPQAGDAGETYLGYVYVDQDGDGEAGDAGIASGDDCNDNDTTVTSKTTYYKDQDGDGKGNATKSVFLCSSSAPQTYVTTSNDDDDSSNPTADDDGDGTINSQDSDDDNDGIADSADADGDNDGVGATSDCDDRDPAISVDQTYYFDGDADGLGTTSSISLCTTTVPAGYADNSADTNDDDGDNDGVDSGADCNDDDNSLGSATTYYSDGDQDGLGNPAAPLVSCSATAPTGYVTNDDDLYPQDYDNDGATTEEDCNDTNADVTDKKYWPDDDGDGLGDPTADYFCNSFGSSGVVTNDDDTNDAIKNNGIEIDDDGVDNDGDAVIDEYNTIAENGIHPGYTDLVPDDTALFALNVLSFKGLKNGQVRVRYSDNSVYRYIVYSISANKRTTVQSSQGTATLLVLHPFGQKIAGLNAYSGSIDARKRVSKKKYPKTAFKQADLFNDGKAEVILTLKKKLQVKLVVVQISSQGKVTVKDRSVLTLRQVAQKKTTVTKNGKRIKLRNSKGKVLVTFRVTKKYRLVTV